LGWVGVEVAHLARLRRIFITKDGVDCEMTGHVSDTQKLRGLLDLSVDIAEQLESKK